MRPTLIAAAAEILGGQDPVGAPRRRPLEEEVRPHAVTVGQSRVKERGRARLETAGVVVGEVGWGGVGGGSRKWG